MYDRDTAMLEKYELTIQSIRKVRGGWLCCAQEGNFLWKETGVTEGRLQVEASICRMIEEAGLNALWQDLGNKRRLKVEQFVCNQDGVYLTTDDYGRSFYLKTWTEGRECDVQDAEDLNQGAAACACFRKVSNGTVPIDTFVSGGTVLTDTWIRRRREMNRVVRYICRRRNKNAFEQMVMQETPYYRGQADQALGLLQEWGCLDASNLQGLCHGDYHYHNLIFNAKELCISQSSRFHMGYPITDFYQFLRKCLEKQKWNWHLAIDLIMAYQKVCPMSEIERRLLYCLFLFPEKYWKQLNFYMQSNKAWMPEKNLVKLRNIINQEPLRQDFLEKLHTIILPF